MAEDDPGKKRRYEFKGVIGGEKVFRLVSEKEQKEREKKAGKELEEGPPLWPEDSMPNAQVLDHDLPDLGDRKIYPTDYEAGE
jgi:hypothetical protein